MSKNLIPQRDQESFTEYSVDQCIAAIRLLKPRIDQLTSKEYQIMLTAPVTDLGLTVRARNVLKINGLDTIGKVLYHGADKMDLYRNCGPKTIKEITSKIDQKLTTAKETVQILELTVEFGENNGLWGRIEGKGNFTPRVFAETIEALMRNVKDCIRDYQEHDGMQDGFWSTVDLERLGLRIKLEIN